MLFEGTPLNSLSGLDQNVLLVMVFVKWLQIQSIRQRGVVDVEEHYRP